MHYVLKCLAPVAFDHYRLLAKGADADKRWESGLMFASDDRRDELRPPEAPIRLITEPEDPSLPNRYAELYWNPIPLMTRRLVAALRSAGVDSLQTYETMIEGIPGQTSPPADSYLAVQVVGRLSVDDAIARGVDMFRWDETVTAVLVHERVKQHVENSGIVTLTWLKPHEWAG